MSLIAYTIIIRIFLIAIRLKTMANTTFGLTGVEAALLLKGIMDVISETTWDWQLSQ